MNLRGAIRSQVVTSLAIAYALTALRFWRRLDLLQPTRSVGAGQQPR
jgi:hypothetical protein